MFVLHSLVLYLLPCFLFLQQVAGGIEKLVISLTSFLKDSKNPEKQREFALATKSVGDHINELVVAADSTAITKILDAVADARDAQRRLFEASQVSIDDMVVAARFVRIFECVHGVYT